MTTNRNPVWGSASKGESEPKVKVDSPVTTAGSVTSQNNQVWFYKDVDSASILDLNKALDTAHLDLAKKALDLGLDTVFPIHLHIHSYGGELLAGLSGADSILSQNVHTHIEGGAASAATLLSVCGSHRTITPHSFMLIHQLSTGFWGKYMDIEDFKGSTDRFMASVIDIYDSRSKLPKAKLKEVLKHDLWFSAEEALKFGLVDEIK